MKHEHSAISAIGLSDTLVSSNSTHKVEHQNGAGQRTPETKKLSPEGSVKAGSELKPGT